MHEQTATRNLITLTEAAKIAPGRPSANCVWRWCRKGVLSRGGERIRLRHHRVGGMIYTTADWLAEFGSALAEADAKYFDLSEAAVEAARQAESPQHRRRRRSLGDDNQRRRLLEAVERELDAAGL